MIREEEGGVIFIGLKREAIPTSNRCGISNLAKGNKDVKYGSCRNDE